MMESETDQDRVILLLDVDCFYAQCERIHLGFTAPNDHETCPIALLQWDSVLAVSYPAREFGIKRGDSWEAVRTKSKGKCLAVHVPILEAPGSSQNHQVAAAAAASSSSATMTDFDGNYDSVFNLPKEEQLRLRNRDIGRRRYSTEGKACLERYRIASRRIFEVVMECLGRGDSTTTDNNSISTGIILEKASIDEFFLDVTGLCKDPNHSLWDFISSSSDTDDNSQHSARQEHATVIVGHENESNAINRQQLPENNALASYPVLERGCQLAHWIRYSVAKKLGFTVSAGISINKMVAKLGAGYGKPNGQAVVLPHTILSVMKDTPISKVRNFGGKLGNAVQHLLPPNAPPTMGSVASLSLPQLQAHFQGDSTARYVFDACRGRETEPVEAKNSGNLVKSITAFKSLPRALDADLEDPACLQWISLLVQEVASRVETDAKRNSRYPRNCTIHYGLHGHVNSSGRLDMKSFRVPFPPQRLSVRERISQLMEGIPKKIIQREAGGGVSNGQKRRRIRLVRIGVCATEMEDIGSKVGSITSYFSASSTAKSPRSDTPTQPGPPGEKDTPRVDNSDDDLNLALQLQANYDSEHRAFSALEDKSKNNRKTLSQQAANKQSPPDEKGINDGHFDNAVKRSIPVNTDANNVIEEPDADAELARKLQASFDRENLVLGALDASKKSKRLSSKSRDRTQPPPAKQAKTKKLTAFFNSSKS